MGDWVPKCGLNVNRQQYRALVAVEARKQSENRHRRSTAASAT
jgi:hypothetical protein